MIAQGVHMTPALITAVRARDALERDGRDNDLEIWPDMATGVLVFFAMGTQWRRDMMGQIQGLDYGVIASTAQLLELQMDQTAFHDIRTMESEALKTIRNRRNG